MGSLKIEDVNGLPHLNQFDQISAVEIIKKDCEALKNYDW